LTGGGLLEYLDSFGSGDPLCPRLLWRFSSFLFFALTVLSAGVPVVVLPHVLGLFQRFLVVDGILKATSLL
jgi:hypothetical protein